MREIRLSGSVEGVVSNHDPYSDSVGLGLYFSEAPHRAGHKKQMPFLAGRGAWLSALSRARSLRLSERSGRPLTAEEDGQGAGFWQGRAEEIKHSQNFCVA